MPDDFDGFSWHDNITYGLSWDIGDPERDTWHCRLLLDEQRFSAAEHPG
jgi:hypothetical protein